MKLTILIWSPFVMGCRLTVRTGADSRLIEEGLLNITNALGNIGYAFVNIVPEPSTSPEDQYVILIRIGTAQKNYIERIEVVNNTRTLDSVVRRELEIVEGDSFNQPKIDRSLRKIGVLAISET